MGKTIEDVYEYEYEDIGPKVGSSVNIGGQEIQVMLKMEKPQIILCGNVLSKDE